MKWQPISDLDERTRYGDEAGFMLCAPELVDGDCNVFGVGMGYYQDDRDMPFNEHGRCGEEGVDYGGWLACKWSMSNDEWYECKCTPTHFARIEPPNAVHDEDGVPDAVIGRYDNILRLRGSVRHEPDPGTSKPHLRWMLAQLLSRAVSGHKAHRWLGFVQGVMAVTGLISVPAERDFTRPHFTAQEKQKDD